MSNLTEKYSGVVVNQNQAPGDSDHIVIDYLWRRQEIFLPADYVRGTISDEQIVPALSGWQLLVDVNDGEAETASLEWVLDYQIQGVGWIRLAEGKTVGAHTDGRKVWYDMLFDEPVDVSAIYDKRFRFGVRLVSGISAIWYSSPNPLAQDGFAKAYAANGTTPLTVGGNDISFCFRVLAMTADDGVDYLGNRYRSAVMTSSPGNVSTTDGEVKDKTWMSKPNPSRFAVESLYFDVSSNGQPVAVDRVLLDPLTPGMYFTIYYSSEGSPETSDDAWDNKLWDRVPQTFSAVNRESHALGTPIVAKYIKIEFSHLQPKHYAPGDFATPVSYKKHPKWVLDYFLARLDASNANKTFLPGRVGVVFDAIDLAYNYYLDDLAQEPDQPVEVDSSFNVNSYLRSTNDVSDEIDSQTLDKISTVLGPYNEHPSTFSKRDYILGQFVQATAPEKIDYPVERVTPVTFNPVQNLREQSVIVDNSFPVMFFYLTARHKYREITAALSHDRAYFAGVREISFSRDSYTTAYDTDQYVEVPGDLQAARNDFNYDHGVLKV